MEKQKQDLREMWALERQYPSQNSPRDRRTWLNQILILHPHIWTIAAGLSAKVTWGNNCLHIMEGCPFQRCLKTSQTQLLYRYKLVLWMAWKVDAGWSKHLPYDSVLRKFSTKHEMEELGYRCPSFSLCHPYLWNVINAALQCNVLFE